MNLILSAGGGGGWAVNAYKPEEVGIISLDKEGILSVFAHELTHNLPGPPNDKGEQAGRLPGVFSEAHAGWYQGKIEAFRCGNRGGHDPNRMFDFEKQSNSLRRRWTSNAPARPEPRRSVISADSTEGGEAQDE